MKKLLLGVCIVLLAISCKQNIRTSLVSPLMISLNGIPYPEASKMIDRFLTDKTIQDPRTSIWFNKSIFNSMDSVLNALKSNGVAIDGVRIYFAKDSTNKNTIVIVATFADQNAAGKMLHRDFFYLNAPYLNTHEARGDVGYGITRGATLYDASVPCPTPNNDSCDQNNKHTISCLTARSMVDKLRADITNPKTDTINTTSEWFDLGIIDDINKQLQANSNADGLRIYFAKRLAVDPKNIFRHVFVLITTQNTRLDNYKCFQLHPHYSPQAAVRGEDDNGEQCPYNCDIVTWP